MGSFKLDIEEILNDRQHGSSVILDKIIRLLHKQSLSDVELKQLFSDLKAVDKSMTIIHHFLSSLYPYIRNNFYHHLSLYERKWGIVEKEITKTLLTLIDTGTRITLLTHSQSGIVLHVINSLVVNKMQLDVYQTESLPGGEGILQAELISKSVVSVHLIKDSNIADVMHKVDFCLLGVDQYDRKGFVNKVGSEKIIMDSKSLNIPVYILGDTRKEVDNYHISDSSIFEYVQYESNTLMLTEVFSKTNQ